MSEADSIEAGVLSSGDLAPTDDLPSLQERISSLVNMEKFVDALELIDRALEEYPSSSKLYQQLGKALAGVGRLDEAIEAVNAGCFFTDQPWECLCQMGDLNVKKNDYKAAVDSYKAALFLNPDHLILYAAIGYALEEQGLLEEAFEYAKKGVELAGDLSYSHYVYGMIQYYLGDVPGGVASLERAIELDPDCAKSHTSLGLIKLATLDLSPSSWENYEWRFKQPQFVGKSREFSHIPRWDGKSLDQQVVIWAEQGLGDAIFNLRFLPNMGLPSELITLCIDERIVSMVKRVMPKMNISNKWPRNNPALNEGTYSLPLCSTGAHALSRLEECRQSPLLLPDQEIVDRHTSLLSVFNNMFKIGLSWFSNRSNENGPAKSIDLHMFEDLVKLPNVQLVNLQYGNTRDEVQEFEERSGHLLFTPEFDLKEDIESLAAMIAACDYIVTVSNTTAHLTGAVGQQGCVIVPKAKGLTWYWHKDISNSYWYPSLRILRQASIGNWTQPVAEAVDLVRQYLEMPAKDLSKDREYSQGTVAPLRNSRA